MSDLNAALELIARDVVQRVQEKLPEIVPVARLAYTLEQAAEALACSPRYVQQLVAEGKIRSFTWNDKPGAKPYFRVADIQAAIDARRDLDEAIDAAKRKGAA